MLPSNAQRALNDGEIIAVWNACAGRGSLGNLVRLLLLAGVRRGEIAKLTRDHLLADRLVLPPLHTKSGEKHEVPLTQFMRTVIAAQPATTSTLVFPGQDRWYHSRLEQNGPRPAARRGRRLHLA